MRLSFAELLTARQMAGFEGNCEILQKPAVFVFCEANTNSPAVLLAGKQLRRKISTLKTNSLTVIIDLTYGRG